MRRSARRREGLFLVEGQRCLREALSSPIVVEEIFTTGDLPDGVSSLAAEAGTRVTEVSDQVLRAVSDSVTPQGAVGLARIPEADLSSILGARLVLVLAGVRDPGNAGTLVRSAVAAGAGGVLFANESVDPYSPKVVRSSAGTLFRLPIVVDTEGSEWIDSLEEAGIDLVAADVTAQRSLYEADLDPPLALVIGNEAWGLDESLAARIERTVGIPMPGPAESLNAGIAGSILLFEIVRRGLLESASDD